MSSSHKSPDSPGAKPPKSKKLSPASRTKRSKSTPGSKNPSAQSDANILTPPLVEQLDPRSVLFAEITSVTVDFYILHHGNVKLFTTPIELDPYAYELARDFIQDCEYLDHFEVATKLYDLGLYDSDVPQPRYSASSGVPRPEYLDIAGPNQSQLRTSSITIPDQPSEDLTFTTDLYLKQFIKIATDPDRQALVFFYGERKFLLECASRSAYTAIASLLPRRTILNTQLFSANFFRQHPSTEPLLTSYFGKIGYDYFRQTPDSGMRNLACAKTIRVTVDGDEVIHHSDLSFAPARDNANPAGITPPSPGITTPSGHSTPEHLPKNATLDSHSASDSLAPLLDSLNRIPAEDLFHPDLCTELEHSPHFSIYDSYIYHFFVDAEEETLARLIFQTVQHQPLQTTPDDFEQAIRFIQYQNDQRFNLNRHSLSSARLAWQKYQVKYLLSKVSRDQLVDFLDYFFDLDFLPEHLGQFTAHLNLLLGEDLAVRFSQLPVHKPAKLTKFTKLFDYPALVHFTPAQDRALCQKILKSQLSITDTAYYLINYRHTLAQKSLATVYPVACQIAATTHIPYLHGLAGSLLSRIGDYLPDSAFPAYERKLYDLYWPRVGSLWPVQHFYDFNFASPLERDIFQESLLWLSSLRSLTTLNRDFKQFFASLIDYEDLPLCLARKAFFLDHQRSKSTTFFRKAFEIFPEPEAIRLISHPDSPAEVDIILKDVFHTASSRQVIHNYPALFEQLLLNGNPAPVTTHLLSYINAHFSDFVKLFKDYEYEQFEVVLSIFTAACTGASHAEELPLLKTFAKHLKGLTGSAATSGLAAHRHRIISSALALASQNVKTATFQRQKLAGLKF